MNTKIEIAYKHIIFTLITLIGAYTLLLLSDIILGLFISILIATALNPAVNYLEKFKIPRALGIISIYITIITFFIVLISNIIPPLISQTNNLIETLPLELVSSKLQLIEVNLESIQIISNQLGSVVPIVKIVGSTFSGIITFFTFAVITFYILLERNNLHKYIVEIVGDHGKEDKIEKVIQKIELQIGSWIRGQLILMFIVGLVTYIGLVLLQIPYALPLAIIAGVLEIIPNIGPTISAIPAILVPLLTGMNPIMAIFVTALYILIQQLENNIIVPRVMQAAVGIHPLLTILLIISGLRLGGVIGAVLAVPVFLVAKVVFIQLQQTKTFSK